jgi:flagella basal body P-ring formation protein FlgA
MRGRLAVVALSCLPVGAAAESLVALRPIPAQTVLSETDFTTVAAVIPGAIRQGAEAVGQQARRAIAPGSPILARDLGPPVLVGRNARVMMRYLRGGLEIATEGRALDKGALGQVIRVMSLGSKAVVSGRVLGDGTVAVGEVACAGC